MTVGLHVQLLGEFTLSYEGERVSALNSPRLRSLMAYLILHRRAPQPRQHLAFLLWPDSDEKQARTNLRNLVHLLRHALPHDACCLQSEGQSLLWEPHTPYILDVQEFETAVQTGMLQHAIELYRGDLLPDCYNDWIVPERERLRRLYLAALEQVVQQQEQARNYQAALGYAERLVREEPLSEAYCRTLIRLQMLTGDRATALRTYHTCAVALRRELGVAPSRATQQLYREVLNGAEKLPARAAGQPQLPLVGRAAEWAQLRAIWQSAAAGQPQLALISGDAGMGKTRLAAELVAWAQAQGGLAAQAACHAAEGGLPYGPIIDWLRSRPAPRLAEPWLREIGRLLPDDQLPPPADDLPWERRRLFEALAHAILAWGQEASPPPHDDARRPVLLFVDNLQWCDGDTLDWLHFLLRFAPHAPLLVAGALRPGEGSANARLAELLTSLLRQDSLAEVALGPLTLAETQELAARARGRPAEPALAERLYAASEGNPLFVVEMARAGDAPPEADLSAGPRLPAKLHALLQRQLAQLSPAALELGQLAALLGRTVDYAALAAAWPADEASLVEALDELLRRRILYEAAADRYAFTHGQLRAACCASMSRARQGLMQRRIAAALAAA